MIHDGAATEKATKCHNSLRAVPQAENSVQWGAALWTAGLSGPPEGMRVSAAGANATISTWGVYGTGAAERLGHRRRLG